MTKKEFIDSTTIAINEGIKGIYKYSEVNDDNDLHEPENFEPHDFVETILGFIKTTMHRDGTGEFTGRPPGTATLNIIGGKP